MKRSLSAMLLVVVAVPWLLRAQQVRAVDASQPAAYLDPSQPLEARVDDLVRRLTLSEKISLLGTTAPAIERLRVWATPYVVWSAYGGPNGTLMRRRVRCSDTTDDGRRSHWEHDIHETCPRLALAGGALRDADGAAGVGSDHRRHRGDAR